MRTRANRIEHNKTVVYNECIINRIIIICPIKKIAPKRVLIENLFGNTNKNWSTPDGDKWRLNVIFPPPQILFSIFICNFIIIIIQQNGSVRKSETTNDIILCIILQQCRNSHNRRLYRIQSSSRMNWSRQYCCAMTLKTPYVVIYDIGRSNKEPIKIHIDFFFSSDAVLRDVAVCQMASNRCQWFWWV